MTKQFTKETLRRAWRTFIQTAISYIAINVCIVDFTAGKEVITSALLGLAISAVSSGIAAVMNLENTETNSDVELPELVLDEITEENGVN